MKMEELELIVEQAADKGLEECGCHASPRDQVFYALQAVFPGAAPAAWELMADFAMAQGSRQREAEKVVVAIYEHRYGMDVVVLKTGEQAYAWKTQIAKEWWSEEFDEEPPADDEIADEYFDRIGQIWGRDEYFNTYACDVKGE